MMNAKVTRHQETLFTFILPNGRTVHIERYEQDGVARSIYAAIQDEYGEYTDEVVMIWKRETKEANHD